MMSGCGHSTGGRSCYRGCGLVESDMYGRIRPCLGLEISFLRSRGSVYT